MFAIFTNTSRWAQDIITDDIIDHFTIEEFTDEAKETAKEEGMKFAHLYNQKVDDYDQVYYEFVTSIAL